MAYVESLGLDVSEYPKWYHKWRMNRGHAHERGIEFHLSFKQWMRLAVRAGLTSPNDIGIHKYHLSRKLDSGEYKVGNCRFLPADDNRDEIHENGVYDRMAAKLRGRTKHTHATKYTTNTDSLSRRYVVRSPSGTIHRGKGVRDLCKEHGLHPSHMSAVLRGEKVQHKGWTGKYIA